MRRRRLLERVLDAGPGSLHRGSSRIGALGGSTLVDPIGPRGADTRGAKKQNHRARQLHREVVPENRFDETATATMLKRRVTADAGDLVAIRSLRQGVGL